MKEVTSPKKKPTNALKLLTEAVKAEKAKRHPLVNPNYLPVTKYSDSTTNGLTKCIIDCLRFNNAFAARINVQGQYREDIGKWTKSGSTIGTSDIIACYNGMFLSIEVKIGKDKMSEEQLATQDKVQAAGGFYFIARDFESFFTWFNQRREGYERC